jgi:SpoIIAA-like
MLTFLDRGSRNVLGVKASGKLTHADYQQFVPRLEELIQQHGKVRVLFELEECQGWEIGAAWDDLRFALKHGSEVERCAVVGAKKWQEWMTRLSRLFFNVKYFDKAELDKAWQWVLGDGQHRAADVRKDEHELVILPDLTKRRHG